MKKINILAFADIHYVKTAKHIHIIEKRKTNLGLQLVEKAISFTDMENIDLIILLGDLVDNGNAPLVEKDLLALSSVLKETKKPVIVAPGNHDPNPEIVFDIFNDYEGVHSHLGYQIINFADGYDEDDTSRRCFEKMERLFYKLNPDIPTIVLQHNPIYPPIESSYPYNLENAKDVMEFYKKNGVILSVSGHAHWGIDTVKKDNVAYLTCPALCEEPFKYKTISFKGEEYTINDWELE